MLQAEEILTELAKLGETHTWEPATSVVKDGKVASSKAAEYANGNINEEMLAFSRR